MKLETFFDELIIKAGRSRWRQIFTAFTRILSAIGFTSAAPEKDDD